ncbi:sulfotransferase domain-containing protein [Paracoccaceae bacterium]|nr:sulfotransferase domain-containing protein [Paracoccaceae bacterium]
MTQLLPKVFLCGFPKSGTTSLVSALTATDQVCFGIEKEPNYYCRDLLPNYTMAKNKSLYHENYSCCSASKMLIDGSITTIYSDSGLNEIKENVSNPKFIIAVRNPLEMGVSLHAYLYAIGHENIASFEKALGLITKRKMGEGIPHSSLVPFYLDYINCVKLSDRILTVKTLFGEGAVQLVTFDDIINDQAKVLVEILEFLQLESNLNFLDTAWTNRTIPLTRDKTHALFILLLNLKAKFGIKKGFGFSKLYFKLREISEVYRLKSRNTRQASFSEEYLQTCKHELQSLENHIPKETLKKWKIKFGEIIENP